jgi:regulator of replication initiation timing
MDINPEEVINNLSAQIGALTTENTMLKMALAKMQQTIAQDTAMTAPEDTEEKSGKKN